DLAELALELELVGRAHVAEQVTRIDRQRGVVTPLHREADLGGELVELLQGALAGRLRHPGQLPDALPVRLDEVADEHVHALLRRGREVSVDVDAPYRLAHGTLDERDATLP